MPKTRLVAYQDPDGTVPLLDWLDSLPTKALDKCLVRLERLEDLGHDLRRPESDLLRDGIHELRAKHQTVNYRILYFFYGRRLAVVTHGFTKQRARVPDREIRRALGCKERFERDPVAHTYEWRNA